MTRLNIFIGSTARRWSESISGHKLLIGNKLDMQQNSSVLALDDFPTSEPKEFLKYSENSKLLSDDYSFYLNFQKEKYSKYLREISEIVADYNNVSIIVASGGLFGNTFTPLILELLEDEQKNIHLIIQQTNIAFLKERELRLINHINQYCKISINLVKIRDVYNKYGNQKMDVLLNVLDELTINKINDRLNK